MYLWFLKLHFDSLNIWFPTTVYQNKYLVYSFINQIYLTLLTFIHKDYDPSIPSSKVKSHLNYLFPFMKLTSRKGPLRIPAVRKPHSSGFIHKGLSQPFLEKCLTRIEISEVFDTVDKQNLLLKALLNNLINDYLGLTNAPFCGFSNQL